MRGNLKFVATILRTTPERLLELLRDGNREEQAEIMAMLRHQYFIQEEPHPSEKLLESIREKLAVSADIQSNETGQIQERESPAPDEQSQSTGAATSRTWDLPEKGPRRGRKNTPEEEQRKIADYYLTRQGTMTYESVGRHFGVSGKTVQRYVDKFKMSK